MPSIDELEAQFRAAQAACEAYSAEITEKYRAAMPDPEDWRGPGPHEATAVARAKAWTDEEHEHLAALRKTALDAAVTLHRARQEAPGHTSGD